MNRFSVIYLLNKQYHHIYCETHTEAVSALQDLSEQEDCKPIGIYDAKTELFDWEPTRQLQYNTSTIERQGKLGDHMVRVAQTLRQRNEADQEHASSIDQLLQVSE